MNRRNAILTAACGSFSIVFGQADAAQKSLNEYKRGAYRFRINNKRGIFAEGIDGHNEPADFWVLPHAGSKMILTHSALRVSFRMRCDLTRREPGPSDKFLFEWVRTKLLVKCRSINLTGGTVLIENGTRTRRHSESRSQIQTKNQNNILTLFDA